MSQLPLLQTPVLEVATPRVRASGFNSSLLESGNMCVHQYPCIARNLPSASQRYKNTGRALWVPSRARTTLSGWCGYPCAYLSPKSTGAFCLVSCWLLAQHPPWHPACPSGQQPHSIHLGGLKVDRGGRIQGFLKEERRRLWDWCPQKYVHGVTLQLGAGSQGCLLPFPFCL
jgi:hypothetical protein